MTPMKSIHRILALAVLAAATLLSQSLHAQANAMCINVPFAFDYADHHFAAGAYTVKLINDGRVLSVGNYDMGTAVAMVGRGGNSRGPAVGYLIFHQYGNRYFLAAYHQNGSLVMSEILNNKRERSAALEFAANRASERNAVQVALLENGDTLPLQR